MTRTKKVKVIGITGQVGSGKSTVAQVMRDEFGAYLLNTDQIAHDLMAKGGISYELIVSHFGCRILDEAQEIDRKVLGQIVFENPRELEELNAMVHPFVMNVVMDEISRYCAEHDKGSILVETAILIESGYMEICDEVWYVRTSDAVRRQRLKESRGYTDEKIDSILANQLSDEEILKHNVKIFQNDAGIEEIKAQIELLLEH